MNWRNLCRGGAVLLLIAATAARPSESAGAGPPNGDGARRDAHSYARPGEVKVTRVVLDLLVDFDRKVLDGSATLTLERQPGCPATAPLVLDTKGLNVRGVAAAPGARALPFRLGDPDPILGRSLTIDLPADVRSVVVTYETTPRSGALQWVAPEGTAGKTRPFLFTQSEAILARSWIPLQDSPGVRVTYGATVRVPAGLVAVMSADRKEPSRPETGPHTYRFEMPEPIPSYLIALAVGDLAFRPLGARTGVFAEPPVVEAAAREFADTEAMVKTVEARYGPYRWGRFDLLVLPPSFPFGGMENPKLTFATPTVLAGDRSLVSLVAHELAHSWSGNLVTNATWRDFWLNEGFTTYLERRVMEDLYGPERADMERVLGVRELRKELAELPPRDQVLHIDLRGRDPDEAMTRIAYEKGALFLSTVERAVGREAFDPFLRRYFDHFAFQSITTDDFTAYLRKNLLRTNEVARSIDVAAWVDQPGWGPGVIAPRSERLERVASAAHDWAKGGVAADALGSASWTTHEWVQFLQSLPEGLSAERMGELDRAFHLTDRGNAEVAQHWLLLAVRNGYAPADARLEQFLTTIGRRKYVVPLYAALLKAPGGATRSRTLYAKARPFYHPITVESVEKLLDTPGKP